MTIIKKKKMFRCHSDSYLTSSTFTEAAAEVELETCEAAAGGATTVTLSAGVGVVPMWGKASEEGGAETTAEVILL